MKNIMTRAWEIAREAVEKFGGKVKEYFAQALKMAWAESKKVVFKNYARVEEYITLSFRRWEKYGKRRIYINECKGNNLQRERSAGCFIEIENKELVIGKGFCSLFRPVIEKFMETYEF